MGSHSRRCHHGLVLGEFLGVGAKLSADVDGREIQRREWTSTSSHGQLCAPFNKKSHSAASLYVMGTACDARLKHRRELGPAISCSLHLNIIITLIARMIVTDSAVHLPPSTCRESALLSLDSLFHSRMSAQISIVTGHTLSRWLSSLCMFCLWSLTSLSRC